MFKLVEYNEKPSEMDNTSSDEVVYVRRNIESVEREGNIIWACEEAAIRKEEWETFLKVAEHTSEISEVEDALVELAGMIGG